MTSRQHQDWINRGKPDSGLALPLQLLANTLAAAGYTVYVHPNNAHLDAPTPEDHTYYSETGWPHPSPKWWRHAIDIMPPTKPGLPSLTQLGQTIFNARQAGQITWLKYMNWPSAGSLSRAVQESWKPGHTRISSSDVGHIHLSSITGVETLDSSFNPLVHVVDASTVTPNTPSPTQENDVSAHTDAVIAAWSVGVDKASDGTPVAPVDWEVRREAREKAADGVQAQILATVQSLAAKVGAPATVTLSPDQLATITAAIVAHPDNPLGDADKPAIEQAVAAAFAKAFPASA